MPFQRRGFRRTTLRRTPFRRRHVPDLVPFTICNDCFQVPPDSSGPCVDRNDPDKMKTVVTVVVDGGAFSALGNATAGMSRGLKFRGMRFDLRMQAGFRLSTSTTLDSAWLYYAVGLAKVTVKEDANGRAPAVLPNFMATAEELLNCDLVYLRKGRIWVPPAVSNGSTARTNVSVGTNDGLSFMDRNDAEYQPGAFLVTNNVRENQIHHRVKTRRNVKETEMLVWGMTTYAKKANTVNFNEAGGCGDYPADAAVQVEYNVEGMLILDNWPS